MIDPAETFITGEGVEVCLLGIPHHWVGGVSLVVRSFPPGIDLLWAAVTDLSDHDQIDLGHVVSHWPAADDNCLDELQARLAKELSRPIEWRQTYRGRSATPGSIAAVLDHGGKRLKIGVLHTVSLWPLRRRHVFEQTSLDAAQPPAFRLPVPIDKLLKQA